MIIYPAIDIMDGRVVRLKQGRRDRANVYAEDPAEVARRWRAAGAEILHVVDLDGAFSGSSQNLGAIAKVVEAVDIPVQLGGGLRSMEAIDKVMSLGVDRVVIGTALVTDQAFAMDAFGAYPGKVVVGLDAKGGKVAISGWESETDLEAIPLAKALEEAGAAAIVYTDIASDGMVSGINLKATEELASAVELPVIASGGVASLENIRRLKPLEAKGVVGVIVGTALYEGYFTLEEALKEAGSAY